MRRTAVAIVPLVAMFLAIAPLRARGQESGRMPSRHHAMYTVLPLAGVTDDSLDAAVAKHATLPMWKYSIVSNRNDKKYSGKMVGRSPLYHGARETDIPVFIIPVKIVMPDGGVFDPTMIDNACASGHTPISLFQNSPILQPASYEIGGTNVGTGQYTDVFQRANFFSNVSITGDSYHTVLSPVTVLPMQTFNVPAGKGLTYPAIETGGCGSIGVVDINTMDKFVRTTLIPALKAQGISPTNLPFFFFYNVVMGAPGDVLDSPNCCVLGYHAATGSPTQTYAVSDFDTTDLFAGISNTVVASHEIAEWMDDPIGNNPTPPWGHTGQVTGCQNNLEVGDPLTGDLFPSVMMNDFTYQLQELAFFSWFYSTPSIGVNGWFSDDGTFETDAGPVC